MFGEAYVVPLDQTLGAIKKHFQADQILVHTYQCQGAVSKLSRSNINSEEVSTTATCRVDSSPDLRFEQQEERTEQGEPTQQDVISGLQTHLKFHDDQHSTIMPPPGGQILQMQRKNLLLLENCACKPLLILPSR
jgi:hypothetical protein